MALGSAARVPISRGLVGSDPVNSGRVLPIVWAAFLTLLIGGLWLAPGYLFGTDWPGPRRFDLPTDLPSWAPVSALLAVASGVVGGELAGKLFILAVLFAGALLAYRSVPVDGFIGGAAASTVFVLNPFVYGRLHYGQWFVLAGYAALPWFALRLRRVVVEPGAINAAVAGVSLALVGVLSEHMFLVASLVAVAVSVAFLVGAKQRARLLVMLVMTAGITLLASAYWIVPLALGRGPVAPTLGGIGTADLVGYAAVPDQQLGLLPNLLGLYGFWAEDSGRFLSMKAYLPIWPAVLAAILLVAAVGAQAGLRRAQDRPWVIGLLFATAVALLLEMGVSSSVTSGPVYWLDAHISLLRGMRDAGKWAALLALAYSQLVALGAVVILDWIRRLRMSPAGIDWMVAGATALLLALPLAYGNGLLFGSHGGIRPSPYPAGWYAADRAMLAESAHDRALFLPWHEYLSFDFIRNENEVVVSPAPTFFSNPVLVSNNPEVFGAPLSTDPDQAAVSKLVMDQGSGRWAKVLADRGIKYVLLARTVDWTSYSYLDRVPGLVKMGDYGSIVLYRNLLVH